MDILEAIKERRSVRNFDGNSLSENSRKILLNIVEHSTSPFGGSVTIRLKKFDIKDGYKPSTYGMIKGSTDFFMLGIGNDEASSLTAGFRFEQVVLKAWQLGLGTCWIAATFKGSTFEDENIWPDGEKLRSYAPSVLLQNKVLWKKSPACRLAVKSAGRLLNFSMIGISSILSPLKTGLALLLK